MSLAYYIIYAAAYKTFLDSGRSFVGKFCPQTLLSKSAILWIYGAFKTTGDSGKKQG
jgi:hypothetical protein